MRLVAPLRIADQPARFWPQRCAATGRPTSVTAELPVVARPAWPWLVAPAGPLALIVARHVAARTTTTHVTAPPAASERHRGDVWLATGLRVLVASLTALLSRNVAGTVVALVVAGTSTEFVCRHRWVSVEGSPEHFCLSGVHPGYLAAALELERHTPSASLR